MCKMPFECRYFALKCPEFVQGAECLFVCFFKLAALTTYFPFPQFVSGGVRHRGQDEQAHPPDGLQDACASVHGEKPADRRGQRL